MAHSKLIGHELIGVLSMGLSQILMKHNAVEDGHAAVHAIHKEKHNPCHILCGQHQPAQCKQDDKCNADASHIAGEAFGLTLRPEIEDAENQHANDGNNQIGLFHEPQVSVQQKHG